MRLHLAICVVVAFGVSACRDDPESSGAKSENSTLLAMMLRHDSEPITSVKLFTEMEYHFVCVPTKGRKIWVMLDARYTPYYKQQPWDQNFTISRADFERIEQSKVATPVVLQCLASHMSDGSP
jgi:hypothetical protein